MDEKKLSYFEQYRDIIPQFDKFLESLKTPQPYWIRVNTLKISEEALINHLQRKGFVFERFGELNAYRVVDMPVKHPGSTLEHSLGYYYVQDLASMAPVLALQPKKGDRVLDMCAAPGSKTTMIAEIMGNKGCIIANDANYRRLKSLAGNIERLGITNVIITNRDARSADFGVLFDRILIDAPCSGEGVFRKNPWGFRQITEREHRFLASNQKKMMKNAVRHLKDNGRIVYSTCTFSPTENESVVKYAVEKLNMRVVDVDVPVPHCEGVESWRSEDFSEIRRHVMRIYPHMVDTGGMFIAVLEKR